MPLLEDATFQKYGYRTAELHPASGKPIVYACDSCQTILERQWRNAQKELLCRPCKIRQPRPKAAIEKFKKTMLERHGVLNALQSPAILAKMAKDNLTKYGVENVSSLPHVREKQRNWWTDKHGLSPLEAPGVLRDETQRQFGYYPEELAPLSDALVACQCVDCGTIFSRVKKNITEPVCCQRCLFQHVPDGVYERSVEKRAETVLRVYGDKGIPSTSKTYGKAQEGLTTLVESWTRTAAIRNAPLDGKKSLDLYLPEKKIAVEYCGLIWHREYTDKKDVLRNGRQHHANKMKLCAVKGIRLVTLFEDEWLLRRNQVEGRLKAILGVTARRVHGRDCEVVELSTEDARNFVNAHHVQPYKTRPLLSVGLTLEGELVAAMVFGKHHRQGHERTLVLQRLCFKGDTYVIGGSQRLFSNGLKKLRAGQFDKIVSWSDNRWSEGGVYTALKFTLAEELPPDYSYVQPPAKRLSKQSQKKKTVNCPPGLTELQWAKQRGLARIWDCGHKRWEYVL